MEEELNISNTSNNGSNGTQSLAGYTVPQKDSSIQSSTGDKLKTAGKWLFGGIGVIALNLFLMFVIGIYFPWLFIVGAGMIVKSFIPQKSQKFLNVSATSVAGEIKCSIVNTEHYSECALAVDGEWRQTNVQDVVMISGLKTGMTHEVVLAKIDRFVKKAYFMEMKQIKL